MMMRDNNLPAVADGRDVALVGEATDAAIIPALQNFMTQLSSRAEVFDDVSLTYHTDRAADGSSRSVFNYRAVKRK
jgi:hypothetical protein